MERVKVLLDTDIGTDIDDAVCLAYLLSNPCCDLLGITTVTGGAVDRASLASVLCRVAGRRVPIFPGVEKPFIVSPRQTGAPQRTALAKWSHDKEFPRGQAIAFLADTIRKHPGEVVLLGIGPLTNVALLFASDPELPKLLKALVLMCGVFVDRPPLVPMVEWNAMLDPHAAAVVYHHRPKLHRSIGLDVTRRVILPAEEIRRRFTAEILRPVRDMAEVWFEGRGDLTFHDPLAAATLFDEAICRFDAGCVDVELGSASLIGATHWSSRAGGPHEVAVAVDSARFFDHYFSVVR